jgi:hypothetical protein
MSLGWTANIPCPLCTFSCWRLQVNFSNTVLVTSFWYIIFPCIICFISVVFFTCIHKLSHSFSRGILLRRLVLSLESRSGIKICIIFCLPLLCFVQLIISLWIIFFFTFSWSIQTFSCHLTQRKSKLGKYVLGYLHTERTLLSVLRVARSTMPSAMLTACSRRIL